MELYHVITINTLDRGLQHVIVNASTGNFIAAYRTLMDTRKALRDLIRANKLNKR